ncbi:MAG: O-antigen ligase family protein [Candidatus Eremiobacteraeota bacterium]|nr:O-antigen ligase family protein [Candidatus Eremiobacteraeota bacterium]MBC5824041.1 O-antigen ligase family protein [Candidatus Eremiobacteraeota bacterium]
MITASKALTPTSHAPSETPAISGAARREKVYIWIIVAAWAFVPEVRRVADWIAGTGSFQVINLIPLILMLPLFWQALKRRRYGGHMNFVLGAWAISFGYALFVALSSGNLFPAFYDLALFCIPTLAGLWVINASLRRHELFEVLTTASLTIATIVSLYGLYQYARPTPWDVAWVHNSDLTSIGVAAPFQLRIFATLNSPGTLAAFLVFAILTPLHRVTTRRWLMLPLLLCTFALGFSLVRTSYLAVALGTIVYCVFCTQRRQLIGVGSVFAVIVLLVGIGLPFIYGSESGATNLLTSRLSTLGDVQNDPSAIARANETKNAFNQAIEEPLGQGLGTVGTSTKLSTSGRSTVLDNGYLSRWLELGSVGFAAYLVALVAALLFSVHRWVQARRFGDPAEQIDLIATAIAVQVALMGAELGEDAHLAVLGVYFWLMVGLALKGAARRPHVPVPSTMRTRAASWAPAERSPDGPRSAAGRNHGPLLGAMRDRHNFTVESLQRLRH